MKHGVCVSSKGRTPWCFGGVRARQPVRAIACKSRILQAFSAAAPSPPVAVALTRVANVHSPPQGEERDPQRLRLGCLEVAVVPKKPATRMVMEPKRTLAANGPRTEVRLRPRVARGRCLGLNARRSVSGSDTRPRAPRSEEHT